MKKVFYLGPENSYSDIVVKNVLGKKEFEFITCNSFLEIMDNTILIKNSIGVLPIENSITSDIHENIDFLFKNTVSILYESFLQIHLHLFGLKTTIVDEIQKVYSHPRALAQCAKFMNTHRLTGIETTSTSAAKEIILKEKQSTFGAIGSKEVLQDTALQIIAENIGDNIVNMTRFVFVTNETHTNIASIKNKATIVFTVVHQPGSLATVLTQLAQNNLTVTKIESRPIPGTNWEYQFWIDIKDPYDDLDIQQISHIFASTTQTYTIMGVYKTGTVFES